MREGQIKLILNGQKKEELNMTFAIKHLGNQHFMTSTDEHVNIYDVRYPAKPVLLFMHMCDENPLNVLGVSEVYDPFNTDNIDTIDDLKNLMGDLSNLVGDMTLD
jgi:hypothetical protein